MTESKETVFLAYVPVIHQGYLQFFQKHSEVKELWLIGADFTEQYRPLVKDLRALSPEQVKISLEALKLFDKVEVLTLSSMKALTNRDVKLISPEEEVTRDVVSKYFSHNDVEWETIFLRWDKKRSESRTDVHPDQQISGERFDQEMIALAESEGVKSSDWWRQVGAVILKEGKVIAKARNIHVPQDYQQYSDGDPRADYQSGEMFSLSSSLHAESAAIAEAAKKGISLDGTSMYASTFPCPVCAKLIAYCGIKKLYFNEGYALLDGETVLKAKDVEVIKVND